MKESDPYKEKWVQFKKTERLSIWTFWMAMPILALGGYLSSIFDASWIFKGALPFVLLSVLITGYRARVQKCPRCGEGFYAAKWFPYYDGFSKSCLNCGLKKWASS